MYDTFNQLQNPLTRERGVKILEPLAAERTSGRTSVQMTLGPLRRDGELPTSYKNQPHLLVNCDWLTVRLSDVFKGLFFEGGYARVGEVYRLELMNYGTKFFNKLAKVYYGDVCFAEVQFDARMEVLKDTMFLKYENWIFYDYQMLHTLRVELFENFYRAVGCEFLGITRCDIAVDGVDFNEFIRLLAFTETYQQLKVRNVTPTQFCMDDKVFRGFTVGRRGAKKYAVYYDKSQEIEDGGFKKQYILDYFNENGFSGDVHTHRFELRLNSEAFADMKGFEFSSAMFFEQSHLIEVLEFQLRNFFEFVPHDSVSTDVRRSRREKVQLFDFDTIERKYVRVKRQLLEGVRTAKIMVGRMLRDAYLSDDENQSFANFTVVRQSVIQYHLFEWITRRAPFIMSDIEKYAAVRGVEINDIFSRNPLVDVEKYSLHFN